MRTTAGTFEVASSSFYNKPSTAGTNYATSYRSLYPKSQQVLFGSKTFSHLAPNSVKLMVAKEYEAAALAGFYTAD